MPNPNQPRRHFSVAKMEELVTSIRERGVLQAIRVREIKPNETYDEIIAGERRWRAAKEVGLTEIPALIVQNQTPEQAYIAAVIENIHREDSIDGGLGLRKAIRETSGALGLVQRCQVPKARAAASLREGLDETLTLQGLGVTGALSRTLRSTNAIENLNGLVGR